PQFLVPKGCIFGSAMNNPGFSLVGCMVSPGFTFEDFELFERQTLLNAYPQHRQIIERLTR
ncbi:cupin domain-containing protein, partial [Shewanella sp.]